MGDPEQARHTPVGGSAAVPIDPSGIPGLDEVLGGGIARGSLVLVVGSPGSGKTTVAAQLAFSAATSGRRVLILSALSEPPLKLIGHLRTYRFFDEQLLGDGLLVISVTEHLTKGPDGAVLAITADVRRLHAGLVVLDGFTGVAGALATVQQSREFLYQLATQLSVMGASVVVTSQTSPRHGEQFPEATNADVLVGLHYTLNGTWGQRALEAIKVRGSEPLLGLHGLTIDAAGVTVYPRLEAQVARAAAREAPTPPSHRERGPRAAFDLPALDVLLEGGLTARTSTLLAGAAGVGKTLLSLYFALAGVRAGEPAVWLSFHEDREDLRDKAASFTLGPALDAALLPGGGLTVLRRPSVERDIDVVLHELLTAVDQAAARRVIIDSIGELERVITETSGAVRIPGCLAALLEGLARRGVATLCIRETGAIAATTLVQQTDLVSLLAANVIWLQQVVFRDQLYRVLSVPKMRYSQHDVSLREYRIVAPEGLRVLAPIDTAAGVLVGITQQQGLPTATKDEG